MNKYRIVTDGLTYRIQWLGKTLFLRKPKWYFFQCDSYAGSFIWDYATKQEAETAMVLAEKRDIAGKQGFLPI